MSEPKTRSEEINQLFPWLLHWTIYDERIGNWRGDAYAVKTGDGLLVIDPLPVIDELKSELSDAKTVFITLGGHQRSAWRFRKEFGAEVYVPAGATGLDEEPDHWYEGGDDLPYGLKALRSKGFKNSCSLIYTHDDGRGVLFCADLITNDPDGPYRFPLQEGYFSRDGAREDAKDFMSYPLQTMCAGHANPTTDGCMAALQSALDYDYS